MTFGTITGRRKRSQDVADEIERMINGGTFRPGDRLPPETELARTLGVGRPSVREALFMLQFRGLVETGNGARATVTVPTADFLIRQLSDTAMTLARMPDGQRHLEEVRQIFESGTAWLAAQYATAEDLERLKKALEANINAMGNADEFVRTDVAFHYELTRIARNPVFDAFHKVLVEWLTDQRRTTISLPDADKLSVRDHKAICEAVAAQQPARAFHEMASHLRLISRLFAEAMRLRETLLRKVTQEVAEQSGAESAEIWNASFHGVSSGADAADDAPTPVPARDRTAKKG